MHWHPDEDVDRAIIRLLDALCMWERSTGRQSLFVLIPVETDESVVVAESGKPLERGLLLSDTDLCERVGQALRIHDEPNTHDFFA